jgi:hypothetical protein
MSDEAREVVGRLGAKRPEYYRGNIRIVAQVCGNKGPLLEMSDCLAGLYFAFQFLGAYFKIFEVQWHSYILRGS